MLSVIKLSKRFIVFHNFFLNSRLHLLSTVRPISCRKIKFCHPLLKWNIQDNVKYEMLVTRKKSSKKKTQYEREDDESEDDESDEEADDQEFNFKGDEVKTHETQAARIDKILKVCLRISRKDIEDLFYKTKVRVNGKILKKKSTNAQIGDEIDVINGFVNENSKLININRIKILNIKENPDNLRYSVKVRKSKSLLIDNYSGYDEWRG